MNLQELNTQLDQVKNQLQQWQNEYENSIKMIAKGQQLKENAKSYCDTLSGSMQTLQMIISLIEKDEEGKKLVADLNKKKEQSQEK